MQAVSTLKQHGDSATGRAYIDRDRAGGHQRLYNDYFAENPTYTDKFFRRRFRMRRHLFLRLVGALQQHDDYFVQKRDAAGILGLSPL